MGLKVITLIKLLTLLVLLAEIAMRKTERYTKLFECDWICSDFSTLVFLNHINSMNQNIQFTYEQEVELG